MQKMLRVRGGVRAVAGVAALGGAAFLGTALCSDARGGRARVLEGPERAAALASVPLWSRPPGERDCIRRQFVFDSFETAFAGFMTGVAFEAARCDHHPEWSNVYNRVEVTLATHECNGLSQRDVDMARFMDRLAASLPQKH